MKGPSLKVMVALLGLPLFVALADWAWTQGPISKYKTDGAFAYYDIYEEFPESSGTFTTYGNLQAYLNLSERAEALATGGTSGPFYQLNFRISISSSAGYGEVYGDGPISVEYVTSDKPANHNLTLKVDTNLLDLPFYRNEYGNIPVEFPKIALCWTRTNNDWYRWEGHQIQDFGSVFLHSQGTGVRYYTIPTGSITLPDVGLPISWSYANGWLGTQKAMNWTTQRGPKP